MKRQDATDLVFDLIETVRALERSDSYSYTGAKQDYEEARAKVIDALSAVAQGPDMTKDRKRRKP